MNNTSPFAPLDTGGIVLKVDVINDAYSQLRISGLTVNPTPEDLELALMRYESMMAEYATRNITVNYNFEDEPDPNSDTNVIMGFKYAMATNLAVRLLADFGKQAPPSLAAMASSSLDNMSGAVALAKLQQVQYPRRMGRGSGNTLRYNRWARFYRQVNTAVNTASSQSIFVGDINDYVEHFDAYLDDGEIIASYSIQTDPSLILVTDSNTDVDVEYRIQADDPPSQATNLGQLVTIIVTTSTGRVETRQINFQIVPRAENVI